MKLSKVRTPISAPLQKPTSQIDDSSQQTGTQLTQIQNAFNCFAPSIIRYHLS